MELVPVCDFTFMDYDGTSTKNKDVPSHATLTCKNHLDLRWSTKNPYQRNVHYLGLAQDVEITKENGKYMFQECDCSFHELLVIVEEAEK